MRAFVSLAEEARTFGYFAVADQDVSLLGLTLNANRVGRLRNIATDSFTLDWADAPNINRSDLVAQPVANAAY
jgi:hypothetical protein